MSLAILWFIVLGLLWCGFLILEGFDFGVGMLHGFVGGNELERRVAINAIGPVWDGNEVWLVVAGAGMFAAFPDWYATMFSGMYLALAVVLIALIIRGVSFEFRAQLDRAGWHFLWSATLTVGSFLVPLLVGVAFGNLVRGLPIDARHEYTGSFFTLLNPYSLLAGLTVLLLCILHGATFLALKTKGVVRDRAEQVAAVMGPLAALFAIGFAIWTPLEAGHAVRAVVPAVAVVGVLGAIVANRARRNGWAFLATGLAMLATGATFFVFLYPHLMVSSTNAAYSLTVSNASSSSYTLKVMTVVTVIFFPLVLLYQGWTYHVFRRRIDVGDLSHGGGPSHSAPTSGAGPSGAPAGR
jgi:cytochrome d ubiquinol oxidase subunit II